MGAARLQCEQRRPISNPADAIGDQPIGEFLAQPVRLLAESDTGGVMAASPPELAGTRSARGHEVSLIRLLWAAPVVVIASVAVNWTIKLIVQALDPSLARMGQLQEPLVILTVEGAVGAVILFALLAWLVPRPIFWFRIVSLVALAISLLPDVALLFGGNSTRM